MDANSTAQAATHATQVTDDVILSPPQGDYSHEVDAHRRWAIGSPPVWMRDFTARRAVYGGAK